METQNKSKLLYGDLSYKITGILFETHNELGQFGKEKQYADTLEIKFRENGVKFKRELRVGESGNIFDFLVEETILLELEAKPFLLNSDYDQVKRYLQSCDLELGILVNLGLNIFNQKE